jgi:HPt (histidine-containing phosphotransfer) domain-containing protein
MEQPNLSYINKLSKGDLAFEKNILSILNEELQEEINNYHQFIQEKNYKKAKEFVHRIKHKMSILGLEKSYEITNNFENSFRNDVLEHQEYFENMLPIMTKYLKTM